MAIPAKNKGLFALWGGPFVLKSVRGEFFSALKSSGWGSIFMKSQVLNDPCYGTKTTYLTNNNIIIGLLIIRKS